jgi:hypothetical protein
VYQCYYAFIWFVVTKLMGHIVVIVFCVGPAVTNRMYCSLPGLIVLTLLLFSPSHLQRRSTSTGMRDLYQRKVEL